MQPYSVSTKYRKIASQVAMYLTEAHIAAEEDKVDQEVSCSFPSDTAEIVGNSSFASNSSEYVGDIEPLCSLPLDSSGVTKISSQFPAVGATQVTAAAAADICFSGKASVVHMESNAERSCDNESIDGMGWTPRLIDIDYDDQGNSEKNEHDVSLRDKLRSSVLKHNLSHAAITDILGIFSPYHPELPKSAKSLLETQRKVHIKMLADGEYYFFGLSFWLKTLLDANQGELSPENLTVNINIDGVPIFNSSRMSMWPILGSVPELGDSVFPIALYCGLQKPKSLHEYADDFIWEMQGLQNFGFSHNGKLHGVRLEAIICDAPARSFVKCIKAHSGYNSCERCVQLGKRMANKIILPDLEAPNRTDDSFASMEDVGHHTGVSPFTRLQFGMVSSFPLDYMHLVCLGVVRRLMFNWLSGRHDYKLSQGLLTTISEKLSAIHSLIPKEFSRKPRSLLEIKLWKATEFRLFLLYTGTVILKGVVHPKFYSNFLDLSVSMRILLCPDLTEKYLDYTCDLLKYFVETFSNLYGQDQLVYNVHSLIHLCDDARRFGALDKISAFKFESYLGRLVRLVRRPQNPCVQIVNRVMENPGRAFSSATKNVQFLKPHMDGPVTVSLKNFQQFKQCNGQHFISVNSGDNCFEVSGKIGLIRNILKDPLSLLDAGHVLFEEFDLMEPFFTDPLDSDLVFVYFVSKLNGIRHVFPMSSLSCKYVLLPYKSGFVALRQMHQS